MESEQKRDLLKIIVSAALLAAACLIPADGWMKAVLFIVPFALAGMEVLIKAAKNIFHGEIFDENFLMSIATIGAFATGQYPEAVAVMLFYDVGELFEDIAVGKSRRSISALMNIKPDHARGAARRTRVGRSARAGRGGRDDSSAPGRKNTARRSGLRADDGGYLGAHRRIRAA
jgi:cation transport ATPase